MAITTIITEKKTKEKLKWIPCIQYFGIFKDETKALLYLKSVINILSQVFAFQFGLKIRKTTNKTQKIDSTTLKTYGIRVSIFLILDKDGRQKFFEKNFLLVDIKLDVIIRIFFPFMRNADIDFQARDLY